MDKIPVAFKNVEDVNHFVHVVSKYNADFDLYCGSYCVDAKSILGIMTMDLRNKMYLISNCDKTQKKNLVSELSQLCIA